VASILKEVGMSKKSLYAALATALGVMALACWLVTTTLPLSAAPQVVNDGTGVSVDLGGAALLHRSPVTYPQAARSKRIEGDVSLDLTLDSNGAVADARVISGPIELRNAAQQSVLQWHFLREAGPTRRVTISFRLPANRPNGAPGEMGGVIGSVPTRITPADAPQRTVKSIVVFGVPDQAQADLLRRLPVHQGDVFSNDLMRRTSEAIRDFDEHLSMSVSSPRNSSEVEIQILAPGVLPGVLRSVPTTEVLPAPPAGPTRDEISRMRIGANVMAASLITAPKPVYPALAKQARIQGVVKLSAVIGVNGAVQNLEVVSGHPLLVPAALEAVRQWVYQPTLVNGEAVEVITQIDVNFTLSE
jgi:TonB family protein